MLCTASPQRAGGMDQNKEMVVKKFGTIIQALASEVR